MRRKQKIALAFVLATPIFGVTTAEALTGDFNGVGSIITGILTSTSSPSTGTDSSATDTGSSGQTSATSSHSSLPSYGSNSYVYSPPKPTYNIVDMETKYDSELNTLTVTDPKTKKVVDTIYFQDLSFMGNATAAIDQETLTESIQEKIEPPTPAMDPPSANVAVGKDVYAHVEVDPQQFPENVAGQDVNISVEPASFEWDWGDGETMDSGADAGAPWPDGTVTHKYQHVGRYTITCRIHWRGTWAIGKGAPQEIPGDIVTESTSPEFFVKYLVSYLS